MNAPLIIASVGYSNSKEEENVSWTNKLVFGLEENVDVTVDL
jgi:hypothetical protein